ncbi:MAG TPA: aminotransferase class I/II-fold pyridoxal phosphate-dependent enzyme, partial [Opitutaceae bacterium]
RPDAPLPGLCEHLVAELARITSYPEPAAERLVALIACRESVAPDNVLVTNGATAAIYQLAQAWSGRRSRVVIPTFSEYEDAARVHGHALEFYTWRELAADANAVARPGEILWLCNPNNPTGEVLARAELLAFIDDHPEATFVIDLAYAAFCEAEPLRAGDAVARGNLVLVHSLTKNFGMPGLRLGYLVASAAVLREVARFTVPWSVNALAIAAGEYCLRHDSRLALPLRDYLTDARRFAVALGAIPGVEVMPSATGYFLVRLARATAAQLKADLIAQHGLLVRDASNFRGLDARTIRVASQGPEKNTLLIAALSQWMQLH